MLNDFVPRREADLVPYGLNFKTRITATPTVYGLTAAQATAFGTLYDAFVTAFNVTQSDATRTPSSIITKDAAKHSMIANLRLLAGIIQKYPGTTNTMRSDLGLTVPSVRAPIPVPTYVPVLKITKVEQNRVWVQVLNPVNNKRSKPPGVYAVSVHSYVGDAPNYDVNVWKFEGATTRTAFEIEFPADTAPFTQVWVSAQYLNPRQESGVACTPVSTNLGTWLTQAEGAGKEPVKIAA
ncbi:MAG: hypothetical protein QM770_15090 [Tepidisphaeraceae bacterium]